MNDKIRAALEEKNRRAKERSDARRDNLQQAREVAVENTKVDDVFLEALQAAMGRPPETKTQIDKGQLCRPHQEACEVSGRSIMEFLRRLKEDGGNQRFRQRYSEVVGIPPPDHELTMLWPLVFDSHVHNAKQGQQGSVTFLMKHHGRFKPKRAGRPAKKTATASHGLSKNAEKDAKASALYDTLLGGGSDSVN